MRGLARGLLLLGVACTKGEVAEETPYHPNFDQCVVGERLGCFHPSPRCARGKTECIAGPPTMPGTCICEAPSFVTVGLTQQNVDDLQVGAFGADSFYWSEYHASSQTPFSTIVGSALGERGETLIPTVPGKVERLRVEADVLYVDAGELRAFTLSGEPLPAPDEATAFPEESTPPRVRSDETGLYVDARRIADAAWRFAVVDDGVLYIPSEGSSQLLFSPFATPASPNPMTEEPYPSKYAHFFGVWGGASHFYVSSRAPDGTWVMTYADRSIIGQ